VFLFVTAYAVAASWAMHIPLAVGRKVLSTVGFRSNHDGYSMPAGIAACWASMYIIRFVVRDVMTNRDNYHALARAIGKWALVAIKVVVLGTVWLIVPPLLIGVLFELVGSAPFRTPENETPKYPIVHLWALGLVFLKLWVRCVFMQENNVWHRRFERVYNRGLVNIEARFILLQIIVPTVLWLLDFLLVPYFFARLAAVFVPSYALQTRIVRYSFAAYLALRASIFLADKLCGSVTGLYNEIRDSRYLVGIELTNLNRHDRSIPPQTGNSNSNNNNRLAD
jgi:E3 ubiquitin-protein ligase MARCH6